MDYPKIAKKTARLLKALPSITAKAIKRGLGDMNESAELLNKRILEKMARARRRD